jgi:hypothetical protein
MSESRNLWAIVLDCEDGRAARLARMIERTLAPGGDRVSVVAVVPLDDVPDPHETVTAIEPGHTGL